MRGSCLSHIQPNSPRIVMSVIRLALEIGGLAGVFLPGPRLVPIRPQ